MAQSPFVTNRTQEEQDRLGKENEDRVEAALRFLRDVKQIYKYWRSKPYDTLDKAGIDFLIQPFPENVFYGLQAKRSLSGKKKHIEEHGNNIACVAPSRKDQHSDICRRILEELGLSTEGLRKAIQEDTGLSIEDLLKAMSETNG